MKKIASFLKKIATFLIFRQSFFNLSLIFQLPFSCQLIAERRLFDVGFFLFSCLCFKCSL